MDIYVLIFYIFCVYFRPRKRKAKSLDVAGIANLLDQEYDNYDNDSDYEGINVVMFPPIEKAQADSDNDSDESDDPEANINKLPRRLLETDAEVSRGRKATTAEDDPADTEQSAEKMMNRFEKRNREREEQLAKKRKVDPTYGEVNDISGGIYFLYFFIFYISTVTTFRFL